MRDLISLNTKKEHWPRNENRGEDGPSWSFKEGDVPWVLNKYGISLENEFILGMKEPSLYGYTLWRCFTVDENLLGLRSDDHTNLLSVHIM